MICPIGSASSPKSCVVTVAPSTATLAALVTSCVLKKAPVLIGHARMRGRSTSVPCTRVNQFWLPATIGMRFEIPAAANWTPDTSVRIASASSTVSDVADPDP